MKYLFIGFVLSLGWICGCAQTTDSTAERPSARERWQQQFMHRLEARRQEIAEKRRQRVEEIEARPYRKSDSARWSLSLNPFGILELQSAAGLGIGFRVTTHWHIWVESSGLFQLYNKPNQSCLGGIREILAVKYYFGLRETLFFAGEFRYKDVYYHDVTNFNDNVTSQPIYNYTYKVENIIFGGAGWFGGQIRLSENHRWRLEPSIGLGFKGRTVVWHGVPAGWTYQKPIDHLELFPNLVRTSAQLAVYLPATVRLVYVL